MRPGIFARFGWNASQVPFLKMLMRPFLILMADRMQGWSEWGGHACKVCLRDGSAQTTACAATVRQGVDQTCHLSYLILSYLSRSLADRWGTTVDFTTSFLHSSRFSAFRSMMFHSRPVHSLMLSSHRFLCLPLRLPPWTVPCRIVLASPDDRVTCPYHFSLRLFTVVKRSSYGSAQTTACAATVRQGVDQTCHLTRSQYTDTRSTSPSTDPVMPHAWQGSHLITSCCFLG